MGVINEETAELLFKCQRCGADCIKTSALEAELGYISKVDGTFVGPLCTDCFNMIPDHEKCVKDIIETAFVVAIKPGGQGIFITTEGIEMDFKRNPTAFDISSGCNQVISDLNAANAADKTIKTQMMLQQKQASGKRLVLPN
jgi:hypothetical protein